MPSIKETSLTPNCIWFEYNDSTYSVFDTLICWTFGIGVQWTEIISGVTDYLTTEISTSKQKRFNLVKFIDTPGLVDGDMQYPFDVNRAILWLGKKIIFCIFVMFLWSTQAFIYKVVTPSEEHTWSVFCAKNSLVSEINIFFIKGKLNCNWTDINCSREHFRNSYEKLTQTLNFKRAHLSLDFYFFFAHVCFIIWANFFIIIFFFHNRGLGRSDLRVLWSHWSSTLQEDIEHRGGAQQWPLRDNEILSEQSRWGRRWEWQTGTLVNPI